MLRDDLSCIDGYKIAYSAVMEKPEVLGVSLKRMVGARGFEPPASWSRTRCQTLLNSVELCGF